LLISFKKIEFISPKCQNEASRPSSDDDRGLGARIFTLFPALVGSTL
jgi:hypothetical protein